MSDQKTVDYVVRVHEEDDGTLWAEVLDLPGCFASGDNLEELREALQEAISLYVTDDPTAGHISKMAKVDERDVKPMQVGEMRVTVPC